MVTATVTAQGTLAKGPAMNSKNKQNKQANKNINQTA
jgi:hypothetical protein